ncbi:MAG: alkaline phosphatase D family protein [Acidimicrobiales bacterium]
MTEIARISRPLTRRTFLAGTIATAVAACSDDDEATDVATSSTAAPAGTTAEAPTTTAPPTTATTTTTPTLFEADPFTLGVASGDPAAGSVILWTRLAPAGSSPEEDVDVAWEIATDADFSTITASGVGRALAALGHSVHITAEGLEPDTSYHYRFEVAGFESPIGRTRTFAAPGAMPERFRFAFASCQNWEQGHYAAYRDIVERDEIDAFVFLGDYIYELESGAYADPGGRTTGQDFETVTLDQYRARYARYRSDPHLQATHALVPWVVTWDDHEVDNNYAGAISEDDAPTGEFLERRAAAYQAWYEFMPVRLDPPSGPDYPIHRTIGHGDLLSFNVLDTRQYRSDQQRLPPFLPALGDAVQVRDDELQFSPDHTMLGPEQRDWLIEQVEASTAVWEVLAQQVFMFGGSAGPFDPPVVVVDTWDGYSGERRLLLETLAPVVDNLVVLTGDFHSAAVGELRADPFDTSLPVVGVELMASAISSASFNGDPVAAELVADALLANPQIRFFDGRRGYTVCEVTPNRWTATSRAVIDPLDETSPVETISRWEIPVGSPSVTELT